MEKSKRLLRSGGMIVGALLFILAGAPGVKVPAQSQSSEPLSINCRNATDSFLIALTKFDMILFANGGVTSATVIEETFPFQSDAASPKFSQGEITFIILGQSLEEPDRLLKASNKMLLNGHLRMERFRIQTATGENFTLERAQVRAIVFQAHGDAGEKPVNTVSEAAFKIFEGPVGSALLSSLLQSLTRANLFVYREDALLSGVVREEVFRFELQGQISLLKRDDLYQLIIGMERNNDWAILKTGDVLEGKLQLDVLNMQPVYSAQDAQVGRVHVKRVIFQMLPAQCPA